MTQSMERSEGLRSRKEAWMVEGEAMLSPDAEVVRVEVEEVGAADDPMGKPDEDGTPAAMCCMKTWE